MNSFRQRIPLVPHATPEPEVTIAQISAFSKQAPLLYIVGNANSLGLAYTHYHSAPALLTLIVPIPMFLICVVRLFIWKRTGRVAFTPHTAQARLRTTVRLAGILGAIYAGWALCLYPYGDATARCHVAFFMAISGIGTIFCLMHLRPAALLLTVVIAVPFLIRFTTTGDPMLAVMAASFLLVVVIMVAILFIYYRDFRALVVSRQALAVLSDQNYALANLDSLTGLPNRRSFFRDVSAFLEDQDNRSGNHALGIVDLDGFKPINDIYGHAAGDRVLIDVGHRLREVLGPSALVARLGGDEFGIFIKGSGAEPDVLAQGAILCEAVRMPIPLTNGVARVAASIGFAIASPSGSTREQLIEQADYALYHAKAHHPGAAAIFSACHEDAIRVRSLIEQTLRKAELDAEIAVTFQPIVDLGIDRIVAYEALARWNSPVIGSVSPVDFIAAAERSGQIRALTMVLFEKAVAALGHWPPDMHLSFNLSASDIASPDLVAQVQRVIRRHGVDAVQIAFEITETSLMHDFEEAKRTLLGLKALGARISLDDFGTGFSSLRYVHQLPLDTIKIDRTFVAAIASEKSTRDIVKSIIDLCRNLEIGCIAEGIETIEQANILWSLGCRTMQGYLFGMPERHGDLAHGASGWLRGSAQAGSALAAV